MRISSISVPILALAALGLPATQAQAESGSSAHLVGTSAAATGAFTPPAAATPPTRSSWVSPTRPTATPGRPPTPASSPTAACRAVTAAGSASPSGAARRPSRTPRLGTSFEGLNLFQQRYARGGNQFTVEPPDQALCVGNGYVLEAVNDVLNVYDKQGSSVLPDNTATNVVSGFPTDVHHAVDLNSFFGYAPAINRATGVRAQNITDPVCLYDAATQRFFVAVLTLETTPAGALTLQNHIDIAVSRTSDPRGTWNIFTFDATNDGTDIGGTGGNAGPYLGDYPHIGADANGIYVTTNAYPWNGSGFAGAQIYALSKAQARGRCRHRLDAAPRHLRHRPAAE